MLNDCAGYDILDAIEYQEKMIPDKVCITFQENAVTYRSLLKAAKGIAGSLSSCVTKGKRVVIIFPMGLEYIYSFLALEYLGALVCPCYPSEESITFQQRLKHIIENADVEYIITSKTERNKILQMKDLSKTLESIIWCIYDELDKNAPFCRDSKSEEAFIQYSSGTTSTPKGVLISHKNLMCNIQAFENMVKDIKNEQGEIRAVSWMPLYHDMGLVAGLLWYLVMGHTIHLLPTKQIMEDPLPWLKTITEEKANVTLAPNFAFEDCVKKISEEDINQLDLSYIRLIINGAEQISEQSLYNFLNRFGKTGYNLSAMCPCYGLAEATLLVTASETGKIPKVSTFHRQKLAAGQAVIEDKSSEDAITIVSVGSVIDGAEIVIVDPETKEIRKECQVGEIWITGESVSSGYYHNPELTNDVFDNYIPGRTERFLKTGDLGFVYEGQIYLCGRMKEVIVMNGKNINPVDLEQTVKSCCQAEQIGKIAFFSTIADSVERIICALEVADYASVDEITKSIEEQIKEKFELRLHEVVAVRKGTIPLTESGKVKRIQCKMEYQKNSLQEWRF